MDSSLLICCCGICVAFLLWNLCCGIFGGGSFVVESLLWKLCCGIFVEESSLLKNCCEIRVVFICVFVVDLLLWNLLLWNLLLWIQRCGVIVVE